MVNRIGLRNISAKYIGKLLAIMATTANIRIRIKNQQLIQVKRKGYSSNAVVSALCMCCKFETPGFEHSVYGMFYSLMVSQLVTIVYMHLTELIGFLFNNQNIYIGI